MAYRREDDQRLARWPFQALLRPGSATQKMAISDRTTLEAIVRENNRLIRAMVDAFDGLIYICSADYRLEFINDRMIDHIGHDATGHHCYKALHGRRTVCPWCVNHRVLKGETVRWEVVSPKDSRWYLVVNAPIEHIDGSISKYAMMMDIHDRKIAEEELKQHRALLEDLVRARTIELTRANTQLRKEIEERKSIEKHLRESQQRYRMLFDGSRDAIFISDADGECLDLNDAALALTGYSREELLSRAVHDLDDAITAEAYRQYTDRVLAGDAFTSEAIVRRKDGRKVYTEFSSKKVILDGKTCLHTTARDITARKQAEKALRLSETKYRELVQSANSIIIRFDTEGRLTFFNEFAQQFFGYSEAEIVGRNIIDTIVPRTDSLGRQIRPRLEDFFKHPEQYKTNEIENIRRNGERVWVAWTNRPIHAADGQIVEFLCVGLDITERKQAKEQIQTLTHELFKAQENERYKIARDLHDHIAQDLSSLKIGMETMFQSLSNTAGSPDVKQQKALLKILQRSISEVRNMAYDLRPPGLDQLGLVRTLFVYCEDFSQTAGFQIDFSAAGLESLDLDQDTQINLYRLIQEALYNVKKHARASRVTIRLVASSPSLMLRIIDDGIGFDTRQWQAKSFREKRMGLQSMVERVGLLDGSIDIRSQDGKGTAIAIKIPVKDHLHEDQDTCTDY